MAVTAAPNINTIESGLRSDVTADVRKTWNAHNGLPTMTEATLIAAHGGFPRRCPCHGTDDLEHRQRVLAAATIAAERAAQDAVA